MSAYWLTYGVGWAVLSISGLYLLWQYVGWRRCQASGWGVPFETQLLLYPTGYSLKLADLGPSWLRWYLSDFGYSLFMAIVLLLLSGGYRGFEWLMVSLTERRYLLGLSFVICLAYEVLTGAS